MMEKSQEKTREEFEISAERFIYELYDSGWRFMFDVPYDYKGEIRAAYRKAHPPVIVMAIKPKYAKAIYEGRKNWEFRKAPPPIYKEIYIYESAPVSKITGRVVFDMSVTGLRLDVWGIVERCRTLYGRPGINQDDFLEYAGMHDVTALHVYKAKRLEQEVTFGAKPPQNWGRFAATYRDTPKEEGDSHD